MKYEITGEKDNKIRKEISFSDFQSFICIQELSKQGYKNISIRIIKY